MSFECSFAARGVDYELRIEDDGRVCYAYLFDSDGKICGKVWLYNRGPSLRWFDAARGVPPRNPKQFVADTPFTLPKSGDDFSAQWSYEGNVPYARIFIRKDLIGILAPGTNPGWSALAKEDGPVAKVLRPSSQSNLAEIIRDIRALRVPGENPGGALAEMTATDHRGREKFKANHPHPERRIPKDERRRIRAENRAAWSRAAEEGRFDHLPILGSGNAADNQNRRRSPRPISARPGADLDEIFQAIAEELSGSTAAPADIRMLRDRLPPKLLPDWLVDALQRYKLAGTEFDLTEAQDLSGLGADVRWLPARQMIGEACDLEPGATILRSGFLPFGGCAIGTGDPFFFDLRDGSRNPPIVRVPHDYAGGETYPLDAIELVSPSLSAFLATAQIA
jgi:hypothetical protein